MNTDKVISRLASTVEAFHHSISLVDRITMNILQRRLARLICFGNIASSCDKGHGRVFAANARPRQRCAALAINRVDIHPEVNEHLDKLRRSYLCCMREY